MADASTDAKDFLAALPAPLNLRAPDHARVIEVRWAVHRELKTAVEHGLLPQGCEFSIRGDTRHVNVEVVAWPGFPLCSEYLDALMAEAVGHPEVMEAFRVSATYREASTELSAALALVEQIANRHNFEEPREEVEYRGVTRRRIVVRRRVGYALRVTADPVIRRAVNGAREEASPAIAALRQSARAAAVRLGKAATRSICGRLGVEGCAQDALEKLLQLDAEASGRPVEYSQTARKWLVVDTAPCADCGSVVSVSPGAQCKCAPCRRAEALPRASKSASTLEAEINEVLRAAPFRGSQGRRPRSR